MPQWLHDLLWVFALLFFSSLAVGLSMAGLSLGGMVGNDPAVVAVLGDGLVARGVLPISGMFLGGGFGLGLAFAFGHTRFITEG